MVLLSMVNAFNICVVGPSSDLGKELVYQSDVSAGSSYRYT